MLQVDDVVPDVIDWFVLICNQAMWINFPPLPIPCCHSRCIHCDPPFRAITFALYLRETATDLFLRRRASSAALLVFKFPFKPSPTNRHSQTDISRSKAIAAFTGLLRGCTLTSSSLSVLADM